jgi:hypothetical protein
MKKMPNKPDGVTKQGKFAKKLNNTGWSLNSLASFSRFLAPSLQGTASSW